MIMSNNGSSATLSRRDYLPLILFLIIGFLVFRQSYATFVAPYYPRFWDQATQISDIYRVYYQLSHFSGAPTGFLAALSTLLSFKGFLFALIAGPLTLLFGPDRSVIAITNFVFLALAILVLFEGMRRVYDKYLAYVAVGLFLTSQSLFLNAGGMQDLRWDLAGLVAFGAVVLMFWQLAVYPGRRTLAIAAGVFAASICTRFITGVYGLVLIAAMVAGFALLFLVTRSAFWRARLIWSTVGAVVVAALFGLYVLVFHRDLAAYYLAHLHTGEREMRFDEAGVSGTLGLLRYYGDSFWTHFKFSIMLAGLALAGYGAVLAFNWKACLARAGTQRFFETTTLLSLAVAVAAGAAVLLSLSIYSPSPVVIGVLTIPVVIILSVILSWLQSWGRDLRGQGLVSLAVFLIGALNFIYQETVFHPWTVEQIQSARAHNDLYRKIYQDHARNGGRIAWLTMEDGTIEPVFNVFLYEAGLSEQIPHFQHSPFTVFALDNAAILRELAWADIVVVWRDFRGRADFSYPIITSLQQDEANWRPVLEREFVRRYGIPVGAGEIDYYSRPVTIETMVAPNGMEDFRDSRGVDQPRFWLDDRPGVITVRNLTEAPIRALFEADIGPGPSFGDTTTRTLRLVAPGTDQELVLSEARGWHLKVPVTLAPGSSEIQLSAMVPAAAARVAVPGDSRLMIADLRQPTLRVAAPAP